MLKDNRAINKIEFYIKYYTKILYIKKNISMTTLTMENQITKMLMILITKAVNII